MKRVLMIIRDEQFQSSLGELPEYRPSDAGEIKMVSLVFQPYLRITEARVHFG